MRKSKEELLSALMAAAKSAGNEGIGRLRFEKLTGIAESEWKYYWAQWNTFKADAGLAAGSASERRPDDEVLQSLIPCIRSIQKWPTYAEMRIFGRQNPGFPSDSTIKLRGDKFALAAKLNELCEGQESLSDIREICAEVLLGQPSEDDIDSNDPVKGYVYLMKNGKYHKLGKTNSPNRRYKQISLLLPDPTYLVHAIPTDDPSGIEVYWKNRFRDKHHDGEFYLLDNSDVQAFKRRKSYM